MFGTLKSLLDRNYVDLYVNYDEYHAHLETDREVRALEIAAWIEPGSTVLDAGCGNGLNGKLIAEKSGARVEGCDIVDKARGVLPVRVVDFNKEGLNADKDYDYIIFSEVLEHVLYPHRLLVEAAQHARKGVIVSIPNTGYLNFRLQLLLGVFPRQSFTHIHYWTYKDFIHFCEQIGLSVMETKFNPTGTVRSLLKKAFPNLFAYQLYFKVAPHRGNAAVRTTP
jgi:methionine biosynthesis protein MetW